MIAKDVSSPVRFRAHQFSANFFAGLPPAPGARLACVREFRNSLQLKSFRLRDRQYGDGVREIEMTR